MTGAGEVGSAATWATLLSSATKSSSARADTAGTSATEVETGGTAGAGAAGAVIAVVVPDGAASAGSCAVVNFDLVWGKGMKPGRGAAEAGGDSVVDAADAPSAGVTRDGLSDGAGEGIAVAGIGKTGSERVSCGG
jgi:hypothetical protein